MNRRDESGAITVLVAILAVTLIGLCAFVADHGLAYANKRQLQTSADAAALGAAAEFIKTGELGCNDMRTTGQTAADNEATAKVTANTVTTGTATLSGGAVTATCTTTGLEVRADVSGTSANIFGRGLASTGDGDYQLARTATAIVEAATSVGSRLRPLAVCSSEMDPAIQPGDVFRIWAPGLGHTPPASCPQESDTGAGNWWTLDCPNESADDGHGGTSALEDQVRDGCSEAVSIVPGQGTTTGNALNNILATACPSPSTSAPYMCLGGDPGQPDAGHVEDAWEDLIDGESLSIIPVFCAATPGRCDHSSITGTGTNAVFPVHKFIGVTVCGYHFGKNPHDIYRDASPITGGICAASNVDAELDIMESETGVANKHIYLVVVFQHAQVSGSITPSTCPIGDPSCDSGVRQARLTQ